MRHFALFLAALSAGPICLAQASPVAAVAIGGDSERITPACDLPRNFDSVYPRKDLQMDMLAAKYAPDYLVQPGFLSPFRNYSYYRPWYTYGSFYGPRAYPYHYAPSWGYVRPWYGPSYLNPGAMAPPAGDQLYHW